MTVSVVARNPVNGQLGIAVASFVLAVGSRVPFLRSSIGAVAVQAASPLSWGSVALDALTAGLDASDLARMLQTLPAAENAQMAIVDGGGSTAVFSGPGCETHVSSAQGAGVCSAANLMERPDVASAVVEAFERSTAASFGERLLAGLSAADQLGGDVRGRQSAVLRVVAGPESDCPGDGVDLRVDDALDPVGELRRLHRLCQAHDLLAASRGATGLYEDITQAQAALAIAPDDLASIGAVALALLRSGQIEAARPLLLRLVEAEPRTPERLRRLVASKRLDPSVGHAALMIIDPLNTARLADSN